MASIFPGPFGFLVTTGQVEWADFGAVAAVCAAFLLGAVLVPRIFFPPLAWLLAHSVYRLRKFDAVNVPKSGPALIVCNHVSYVDWLFIAAACPRRVRFVGWSGFTRYRLLRWIFHASDTIPIDIHAGPKAIVRSIRQVSAALDAGEVVAIFPEATVTRTGTMLPFHRGIERILEQAKGDVPIVPAYLSQLWGSIFSYRGGKLFWKWPDQIPYPVSITFGKPLPKSTPAAEVRRVLQELSADVAIRERADLRTCPRAFVRLACRFSQLNRPCLIDTSTPIHRTLTYARSLTASICLARWLKARVGGDEKIGVWLPSSAGSVLANTAIAFLRKTSVNLNYTAGVESNRSAARQTELRFVVSSKKFAAKMPLDTGETIARLDLEDGLAAITKWQRVSTFLMVCILPGWIVERFVLRLHRQTSSDLATIIFSSGSTGEPKGVMLNHGNIAANASSFIQRAGFAKEDVILGILPTFHSFGYTVTYWSALRVGCSTVYHPDPRQAKEIGELCKQYKCTLMVATATFLRLYMRRVEPEQFATLRLLVCGAEKLPPSLAEDFHKKYDIWPLEGYGCTELSPVVSVNLPDVTAGGVTQRNNRVGSIGQPIPGVAARIVNPDTEEPLGLNAEGLLLIKGPNVMAGYLNRPDLTAKAVRNGWYNTGDMGKIDDDGFVFLTGRISRFAKIGGEMVPLEKIEEEMHAALGTTDRVLAVIAIPDERRGECLMVLHLPTLEIPKKDLLKKLAEKGMPNLWIPGEREFFAIDEMPVLGTGKLDLKKLKEIAVEKGSKP